MSSGWNKHNTSFPWKGWNVVDLPPEGPQAQPTPAPGDGESGDGEEGEKAQAKAQAGGGNDDNQKDRDWGDPHEDNREIRPVYIKDGLLIKYDSFDAFVDAADDTKKSRSRWRASRHSRHEGSADWNGAESFEEALNMARNGWDEGMVRMDEVAEEFHRRSRWTTERAIDWDVAGSHPDVPVFLSGDPCNMITDGNVKNKVKPLIHIMVNKTQFWGISAERIFNFGAALMVCMDQIEACGTRVELEAVTAEISSCGNGTDKFFTQTVIKRASEHVEKNRIAYAMANPGYLRRLGFSIMEQATREANFHGGYGKPCEMDPSLIPANAVYIPMLQSFGGAAWEKIEDSVKELQNLLGIKTEDGIVTMEAA